jgi:hypothetical protein
MKKLSKGKNLATAEILHSRDFEMAFEKHSLREKKRSNARKDKRGDCNLCMFAANRKHFCIYSKLIHFNSFPSRKRTAPSRAKWRSRFF